MPSHVNRPLVYIASPYRVENPIQNAHRAIREADELNATGLVTAYPPHLGIIWEFLYPHHDAAHWLDWDMALLDRCDSLLRLSGYSPGADAEIEFANERGIPVFYERDDLLEWARGYSPN